MVGWRGAPSGERLNQFSNAPGVNPCSESHVGESHGLRSASYQSVFTMIAEALASAEIADRYESLIRIARSLQGVGRWLAITIRVWFGSMRNGAFLNKQRE